MQGFLFNLSRAGRVSIAGTLNDRGFSATVVVLSDVTEKARLADVSDITVLVGPSLSVHLNGQCPRSHSGALEASYLSACRCSTVPSVSDLWLLDSMLRRASYQHLLESLCTSSVSGGMLPVRAVWPGGGAWVRFCLSCRPTVSSCCVLELKKPDAKVDDPRNRTLGRQALSVRLRCSAPLRISRQRPVLRVADNSHQHCKSGR